MLGRDLTNNPGSKQRYQSAVNRADVPFYHPVHRLRPCASLAQLFLLHQFWSERKLGNKVKVGIDVGEQALLCRCFLIECAENAFELFGKYVFQHLALELLFRFEVVGREGVDSLPPRGRFLRFEHPRIL